MVLRTFITVATAAALAVLAPTVALAGMPTCIYSNVATSSTSDVPGVSGAKFMSFSRPYCSLNGQYWIFVADTDLATTEDSILVTGSDVSGMTQLREGMQAPWSSPGDLTGYFDQNVGINDSGQYVFTNNLGGTAPTDRDEMIVWWNGSSYAVAAQEGGLVPGFTTEAFGTTLNSPSIANDGTIGFRAPSTAGDLASDLDDFLVLGNMIAAQEGTTVPTNQAGGATETWDNFDSPDFRLDAYGNWLAQGDLTGDYTGDDILAYNNSVVVQEDQTLSGLSSPVSSITEGVITPGGDWFARGSNDDGQDWVLRNGNLIAKTGDPVPGGEPGETFSDAVYSACFYEMLSNNVGDFVYAGVTSYADPDFDAVIVVNNSFVLMRQGDPVDLDGNGILDDDAFIDIFNNDDAFLTDDGWFYFTADLRDKLGTDIGQAFMRIMIPEPGTLSLLLVGALGLLRRR